MSLCVHRVDSEEGRFRSVRLASPAVEKIGWYEPDQRSTWEKATMSYDYRLPLPWLVPSPEPAKIVSSKPFQIARRALSKCSAIFIVGYSFGQSKAERDDGVSWDFFVDILRRYPRKILSYLLRPKSLPTSCVTPCQLTPSSQSRSIGRLWHKLFRAYFVRRRLYPVGCLTQNLVPSSELTSPPSITDQ